MKNRQQLQNILNGLPRDKQIAYEARMSWLHKATSKQIPPPTKEWFGFLGLAGRGFGKTRLCAEDSWWYCFQHPNVRLAVVAPTNSDLKKTVFEGESGLLAIIPPEILYGGSVDKAYNSSDKELYLANGSLIQGFSSESYQRLRGPQFHRAWCEEAASWAKGVETWDMLMFGLRLGDHPQVVISTTPKPVDLIRRLVKRNDILKVRGSTRENAANLAKTFLEVVERQYLGTRTGKQELEGELLNDVPGSLWSWRMIEQARYMGILPEFRYITVNIDPSAGDGSEGTDECGIIGTGLGMDNIGYVLADKSMSASPNEWAKAAVDLFRALQANWIVAEANNGGLMIESVIHSVDPSVPVKLVHASRGKQTRAEPISALYEQQKIRHSGVFTDLENQLTGWSPTLSKFSPDRLDALVWGFTALMVETPAQFFALLA